MEIIIKQIREIDSDLHKVICRAEEYRKDVERGINVNHTCEGDMGWTKQDKINSLFEYLEDAKNDIDQLKDIELERIDKEIEKQSEMGWTKQDKINSLFEYLEDVKVIKDYLSKLLDDVEYESVRQKAIGRR